MTDDEKAEKEKTAVASMKNAQSNMIAALNRIETLERGLRQAIANLNNAKYFIPKGAYNYEKKPLHDVVDEQVAEAQKYL